MKDDIKNILDKLSSKNITIEETQEQLLSLYDDDKRRAYLTAKYWGYSNYLQNACGIDEYALPNFIKYFEEWYYEFNK